VKQWLKRMTPDRGKIRDHRHLRVFGELLQDPNLWHLNRRSVSGAFAVGLFVMYLPPLGQMFIAGAIAIALRVNMPISVALVWLSNPLTIPPMYYFSYRVGSWLLGKPPQPFKMEFWLDWHNWPDVVAPLTIGSLVCGVIGAAAGYFAVQGIWRWNLVRQIQRRKKRLSNARGRRSNGAASRRLKDTP
jgi:uncharacterized protein (DUF2062 family)